MLVKMHRSYTVIATILLIVTLAGGMMPISLMLPTTAGALPAAPPAIFNYPSRFDGWQPGDPTSVGLGVLNYSEPPSIIHSFYDQALTEQTSMRFNGFSSPDHAIIDGNTVRFLGYSHEPNMDMVFYEDYAGGFDSISFTLTPIIMNFHSFSESGLLFNGSFSQSGGSQYYTGYALILKCSNTQGMMTSGEAQLSLIYIDNERMDGTSYDPGTLATTRTLIGTYKTGIQTMTTAAFSIQIDKRSGGDFSLFVDGIEVQTVGNPRSVESGFGFFTGYYTHACPILSVMEFSQVAVSVAGDNPPVETYATVRFVEKYTYEADPTLGVADIAEPQTGNIDPIYPVNELTNPTNPVAKSFAGDFFRIVAPPLIDATYRYVGASRSPLDPIRYRVNPANNEIVLFYTADIGADKSSIVGEVKGAGTTQNPIPVSVGSSFDYTIDATNPGGARVAPGDLSYGTKVEKIAAGTGYQNALTSDGTLYAWGSNAYGQIGDNTTTNRWMPVAVQAGAIPASETITQIGGGGDFNLVLTDTGRLYTWGYNNYGQLGDNTNTNRWTPVAVLAGAIPASETITQIAAGQNHNLVLTNSGHAYTWGYNVFGQIGDGTNTNRWTPAAVAAGAIPANEAITQISAGANHNLVLTDAGGLYAWGYNNSGQLGSTSVSNSNVPVVVLRGEITAGETVTKIVAGAAHNLVLTDADHLYSWGQNSSGQLGDNTIVVRRAPVAVLGLSPAVPFSITDEIPSGLSLLMNGTSPVYTITDAQGAVLTDTDLEYIDTIVDTSSLPNQIVLVFGKLPSGTLRFTFTVHVDEPSNPIFINQATLFDPTEKNNPTTDGYTNTNETFHATAVTVTEKYQKWSSGETLQPDTLRGFGPDGGLFTDTLGDPYSPWPFRLRPIMDSLGTTWRLVGYQRVGVDDAPVLGFPPVGLLFDGDTGTWIGDGWCWDSITQNERIILFFADDQTLTIDYRQLGTTTDIARQFKTTLPGMSDYHLPVSNMNTIVNAPTSAYPVGTWSYANAYSLDGGITILTGIPPQPTYPAANMMSTKSIVLYFTIDPVVTVQYRAYGADAISRQNSQLLFDINNLNRETILLSGSAPYSFNPMAQTSISATISDGAHAFSGQMWPVYRGYSIDGGVTFISAFPPVMSDIAANTHIVLYFSTQFTITESFQANDATHGSAGTTLKPDVQTDVWSGESFSGFAPRPIMYAQGFQWHYIGWVMDKRAPDFAEEPFVSIDPSLWGDLLDGIDPPTINPTNGPASIIYIYAKGEPTSSITISERFRELGNIAHVLSPDRSTQVEQGSAFTGSPLDLTSQKWVYYGYQIDDGPIITDKLPLGVIIDLVEQGHTITYFYQKQSGPKPPPDPDPKPPGPALPSAGDGSLPTLGLAMMTGVLGGLSACIAVRRHRTHAR